MREIIVILFRWQARSKQTYLAITTRLLKRNIPLSWPCSEQQLEEKNNRQSIKLRGC